MARILITGMSGTGKSTVLDELRRRGHETLDTDHDGWTRPDGRWDEPRLRARLTGLPDVVVSGTVDNQARLYDLFDHVVLLSAPVDVLLERVRARANNPYGRTPEQRAEIVDYSRTVVPLLRAGATAEWDATRPVAELADHLERLLTAP